MQNHAWHCFTIVFFFSTVFALFPTPYDIFPTNWQLFSTPPPNFLYLPYSTRIGARSLLRRYIHPFGLYKRSLQPAHTSPPATPPGPPPHPIFFFFLTGWLFSDCSSWISRSDTIYQNSWTKPFIDICYHIQHRLGLDLKYFHFAQLLLDAHRVLEKVRTENLKFRTDLRDRVMDGGSVTQ